MKKYLILFLTLFLVSNVWAADSKLTGLADLGTITSDDTYYCVDDPLAAGTGPTSKSCKTSNLLTDTLIPNTITIDNATTATALAANPTDCGANAFATAIADSGNLTCSTPTLGTDTDGNYVATLADAGNTTITVANGTAEGGAATVDAIDVNCTACIDAGNLATTDVAAGTYQSSIITVDEDGRVTYAASGGLTGLSDIGSATQGSGRLLISDNTSFDSIAMSGDITIDHTGATTIGTGKVGSDELASTDVAASTYQAPTITVDADGRLTYAASGGLTGLSDIGAATQGSGRLLISDNSTFDSIVMSGDATIDHTGALDIASTDVVAASYTAPTITVQADGRLTYAATGELTGLSDVSSSTQTSGNLLLSDGTDFQSITMSGDCTVTNAGVMDCSAGAFDATAVDDATWSDGANAANTWTFDVSGTNHTMIAGDGLVTFSNGVGASGVTVTDSLRIPYSATPPACTTGDIYQDADGTSGEQLYLCEDGAFVKQGDGGGSITGTDTHVTFFDGADNPAGDAGFVYNKTTDSIILVGGLAASGVTVTTAMRIPYSDTPPACTTGDVYQDTNATSGQQFYVCENGTFVVQGDGGGAGADNFEFEIRPQQAKLPSANPMAIDAGEKWRGLFDDTTDECASWVTVMTPYNGGTLKAEIIYTLETPAVSKVNEIELSIMCISDGEDLGAKAFGSVDNLTSGSITINAGTINVLSDASLNEDSCAEDDLMYIQLCRDADDTDTAVNDLELRGAVVYED